MRDKIDALVEFQITGPDLSKRVGEGAQSGECMYYLFVVDEHMSGLGGGHYRAYTKNLLDNERYYFDDSYVTKPSAHDSINANTYLLFYRRCASDPKAMVDKFRASIGSNPELESHTPINMVGELVVRDAEETEIPPLDLELSGLDLLLLSSTYDLASSQPTYDVSQLYGSNTGSSDDDPSLTSPSPTTAGSGGAEFDSTEEKDLEIIVILRTNTHNPHSGPVSYSN